MQPCWKKMLDTEKAVPDSQKKKQKKADENISKVKKAQIK